MTRFTLAMIAIIALTPAIALADDIDARDGWARATPPTADVGAVYLTITNAGDASDRLIAARTGAARSVEIHRTTIQNDIMRMRPVDDIVIAPGERIVLDPDGYHLMLFGLAEPLAANQTIPLELDFEHAGTIVIDIDVRAAFAGQDPHQHHAGHVHGAPAPIGVMGDHMHGAGEWMLSYGFMQMDMEGNRIGTDGVSPETIATTIANPHSGPATLRVVPTDMTTDMHMFGLMAAPTDWLTLMAMGTHLTKKMDHVTFSGMTGTTRLGTFTTRASGFGDAKLTGLIRLYDAGVHHVHLNAGISLPTGSIDEGDTVLTPANASTHMILPYAMQLGSGTYDLLSGITYTATDGDLGWGAQYIGTFRVGDNDASYSLGNEHHLTAWGSYQLNDWVSTSLRVKGRHVGKIDGSDSRITAPVQTADPDNYGGKRVDLSFGIDVSGQGDVLSGHRFGIEIGTPVYQNLNGPQMEANYFIMVGWKFAFGPL